MHKEDFLAFVKTRTAKMLEKEIKAVDKEINNAKNKTAITQLNYYKEYLKNQKIANEN